MRWVEEGVPPRRVIATARGPMRHALDRAWTPDSSSIMSVGLLFEVVEVEVRTDAYASCHQKRQVTLACPTSGQL